MLSWEMTSKNIFAHSALIMATLKVPPAEFLISVPKVKILLGVGLDPIFPNLPIRSKTNVSKKG